MPVDIASIEPASTAWTSAVSAPSSRISANANGMVERVLARRLGDPGPRLDGAAGADLDEVQGQGVSALGVVLERRADHLAATADAEEAPVAQPGEEFSDHRPGGAGVGVLERVAAGGERHAREPRGCDRRDATSARERWFTMPVDARCSSKPVNRSAAPAEETSEPPEVARP